MEILYSAIYIIKEIIKNMIFTHSIMDPKPNDKTFKKFIIIKKGHDFFATRTLMKGVFTLSPCTTSFHMWIVF
jgi:hypothetical protein